MEVLRKSSLDDYFQNSLIEITVDVYPPSP